MDREEILLTIKMFIFLICTIATSIQAMSMRKKAFEGIFCTFACIFLKESSIFKENLFFTKVYVIAIFIPSQ